MKVNSTDIFRPDFQTVRSQMPHFLMILALFVVTVLLGSSLKDPLLGRTLVFMSLVYPAVTLLTLINLIPKYNYAELSSEGITVKNIARFNKFMNWSDIEAISKATYAGVNYCGILQKSKSVNNGYCSPQPIKNKTGFDRLLNEYSNNKGVLLSDAAILRFDEISRVNRI